MTDDDMTPLERAVRDAADSSHFTTEDCNITLGWMQQLHYPEHQILEILGKMARGIYTPLDMLPMIDAPSMEG